MRNCFHRYSKFALGIFVLIAALSLIYWMGDSGSLRPAVVEAKITPQTIFFDNANPNIRAVMAVQDRHTPNLMALPEVVGTGTGIGAHGQPVIRVFTTRAGVPGIPLRLEGVPVEVEVTGMIVAYTDPTARFARPVPIGVSTGHPDITAGTIGCRVIDGQGNVYALSNNHVYANSNEANVYDEVIQPGTFDGGSLPDDYIGNLEDFEPIDFSGGDNYIDAAIAISSTDLLGNSTPADDGYGIPSSVTQTASIGLAVQKYGRTTGLTYGEVSEINVTVDVCYECAGPWCFGCKKLARFVDQIAISDGEFSSGGDSGSLIVTRVGNNPVGLLFAGSSTNTIANQIGPVLDRFNVTIDDGSATEPFIDIAVTAVSDPASVVQGDAAKVDVTVKNLGNQGVTSDIDVTLTDDTDGVTIGTQTISGGLSPGASTTLTFSWDTGSASLGDHTLTASHDFADDDTSNNSKSTTVTVNEPSAGVSVTGIEPATMGAGTTIDVTITGSGFVEGADVTFENGAGPAPEVSNIVVVDANTITATVTAKSGGPPRDRVWDVRVTNPDGSSGVLVGGFTVNP